MKVVHNFPQIICYFVCENKKEEKVEENEEEFQFSIFFSICICSVMVYLWIWPMDRIYKELRCLIFHIRMVDQIYGASIYHKKGLKEAPDHFERVKDSRVQTRRIRPPVLTRSICRLPFKVCILRVCFPLKKFDTNLRLSLYVYKCMIVTFMFSNKCEMSWNDKRMNYIRTFTEIDNSKRINICTADRYSQLIYIDTN